LVIFGDAENPATSPYTLNELTTSIRLSMLHRQVRDFEAVAGAAVFAAGENPIVLAHCVLIPPGGAIVVSLAEQFGNIAQFHRAACGLFFRLLFLLLSCLRLLTFCRYGRGFLDRGTSAVACVPSGGLLLAG
jgi:hypothetical protein